MPGEYMIEFRNGRAWAKNEYYAVAMFHVTVLSQIATITSVTTVVHTTTVFPVNSQTTTPQFLTMLVGQFTLVSVGITMVRLGFASVPRKHLHTRG